MARTAFAIGNPAGQEVGPTLIADDTEISGIEVREEFGHGLIDARLHFRKSDGSTIPGNPQTGWLTENTRANYVGTLILQKEEVFAGLFVVVEDGHGIVNLRIMKRNRDDGTSAGYSVFAVHNQRATAFREIEIPSGALAKGLVVREEGGFGLIDIAIDFEQ